MLKNGYKSLIIGSLVLLTIAVVFFVYFNKLYKTIRGSDGQYIQSYTTFSLKGEAAIPEIQSTVEQAQKSGTADDVAGAKMILATALFSRNQGDDRQQAATILKNIIADQTLSAATRASAYSYMASWQYTYGSQEVMKEYVFNTSPYSDYLAQQEGDVTEATVYLLTLANNLQANAFNNYESAGLLAFKLRSLSIDSTNKDQQEVARRAQAYIVSGDSLMQEVQTSNFYQQNPGALLFLYTTKSIALTTIQPFFPESISNAKVSDSFEKALSSIEAAKGSLQAKFTAPNARFEYAVWLTATKDIKDANTKAAEIVSSIRAGDSESFDSYIKTIHARTSRSYAKRGAIRVAAVSPEFKKYLLSQGWQESDFSSK